jgi:hypothetical protein
MKKLWIRGRKSIGSKVKIYLFELDKTIKNSGECNSKKMDEINKLGFTVYQWGILGKDKMPYYNRFNK